MGYVSKRVNTALFIVIISLFVTACTNKSEVPRGFTTDRSVLSKTTLLATITDDESADGLSPSSKHAPVTEIKKMQTKDTQTYVINFNKTGRGVAYVARVGKKIRVVHNGIPGKLYDEIEAFYMTLSPDGQRVAYGALQGGRYLVVVDGKEFGGYTEIGPPFFSPDSKHFAFEFKLGPQWRINVDGSPFGNQVDSFSDKPVFSGDSKKIVIYEGASEGRSERIAISDLNLHKPLYKNVHGTLTLSNDNSRIAFLQKVGEKFKLVHISLTNPEDSIESSLYEGIQEKSFSQDSSTVAFVAQKNKANYIVFGGREEILPTGGYPGSFTIRPDKMGVDIILSDKEGTNAFVHHAFTNNRVKNTIYADSGDVVYSKDSRHYAHIAFNDGRTFIVLDGKPGPGFDKVISPLFSPDGKYLVYRARQDGKRFVVVADTLSGNVIKKLGIHDRVFDVTFTDDGKSVAYGVQDGKQIIWQVDSL